MQQQQQQQPTLRAPGDAPMLLGSHPGPLQQLLLSASAYSSAGCLLLFGLGVADADAAPQQVSAIQRHSLVQPRLLPAQTAQARGQMRRRLGR